MLTKNEKEKIRDWRDGGFSYVYIAKSLDKKYSVIKKYCERYISKPIVIKKHKAGKYDHLFDEPVARGKMYNSYVKKK